MVRTLPASTLDLTGLAASVADVKTEAGTLRVGGVGADAIGEGAG